MGSKSKKNKKEAPAANTTAAVVAGGNRVFGKGNKVITDERFSASQKDPRFQDVPKHKNKVAIDSRFSRMFTDKNFSTSSARVDKRGRAKQDGDSSQNALKHYYRIDNEEKKQKNKQTEESDDDEEDDKEIESEEENEEFEMKEAEKSKKVTEKLSKSKLKSKSKLESEAESESETEKEFEMKEAEKSKKVTEKLSKLKSKLESESEAESESESEGEEEELEDLKDDWTDTDTDEDEGTYLEEENDALQVVEENVPEIDKETHRLAIVNLDWNQVQAVDLYVVLSSFLPKSGQILSVSVYPSEFGLKRMEEEAVRGPVGLFDDEDGKNTKKDEDDSSDDDSEIDTEKLRAYELSRLRYYFAVVVCDSIATADYLYKSCDGIEFERSSNRLDLRFIPDSMEFPHPARDVATEAPANYEGIDFQTRALQLSKIDLTWDENEPQRSKKLKRKINVDQESEYVKDELELKEFIASSDSETDEDENDIDGVNRPAKKHKTDAYRALLQSGDGSDEDEDDDQMDMEVTFNTGLEDLSKKILEKKDKKSETVWDAYLRKKKEKKKARKNRSKNSSDDESGDSDGEPIEEPGDFFTEDAAPKKKASGDKRGQETKMGSAGEEGAASRAELELLLADDDGGDANVKGYNLKRKKSKGKKGKHEAMDEEKIPTVDYDDPRFSSLFTRPDFALDPTNPQFKRSAAYARQVIHKQNKGEGEGEADEKGREDNVEVEADKTDSKKDKHEMSLLLKSIKMKSKQVPLPSEGKKSRRKGK